MATLEELTLLSLQKTWLHEAKLLLCSTAPSGCGVLVLQEESSASSHLKPRNTFNSTLFWRTFIVCSVRSLAFFGDEFASEARELRCEMEQDSCCRGWVHIWTAPCSIDSAINIHPRLQNVKQASEHCAC